MRTPLRLLMGALLVVVMLGGWREAAPAGHAQAAVWTAHVFDNPDLAGAPRYTTTVSAINFLWPYAPVINGVDTAAHGVPPDRFSARFTTSAHFAAGTYRFTVQVDDGARVWVDGAPIINEWTGGALRTLQADHTFVADGPHAITVEMYDSVLDAGVIFNWALASAGAAPPPTTGSVPWVAEFFNGLDLTGPPIFAATYPPSGLNLTWGQGSPGGAVPADNFSARFTRSLNVPQDLPEGMYRFYARADDNLRLRVDSTLILDQWESFAAGEVFTADVALLPGAHTLSFEYRERTADASLYLTWTPPNAQAPVLPPPSGAAPAQGVTAPAAATGVTGTVNVTRLNFREAPTLAARILSTLGRGATHSIIGRSADNRWAQLVVSGTTGWSFRQYLTISGDFNSLPIAEAQAVTAPAATPAPPVATGVVVQAYGNMNIRSGPGLSFALIGRARWGSRLELLAINPARTWYKVRLGETVGWSYAPWYRVVEGSLASVPVETS